MSKKNLPAILNALSLMILYLYFIGINLNFITESFKSILVPTLIVGFIAELWFLIKTLKR